MSIPSRNSRILSALPDVATAQGLVQCALIAYSATGEGAPLWEFLYAPESLSTDKNARYSTAGTQGNLPTTNYDGPALRTVRLNNLLLDGWSEGKNMGPLAEGLERLTKPATQSVSATGSFAYSAPPVLSFIMGGRTVIAPCKVVATDRVETLWGAGGEILEARLSLTLEEVSRTDIQI